MPNVKKDYEASVKSRIEGARNSALAMAAPLESGPPSKQKVPVVAVEEKKPEVKSVCQKAGLLTALLSVGALRPALSILVKFPWLVDVHLEVADLFIQFMKLSTSLLYESTHSVQDAGFTQPKARYGSSGLVQPGARKPLLTLMAPTPPSTSTTDFVFFYPAWHQQVPITASLDEIQFVIEPLLRYIGPHLSRDPVFLTRLTRLARTHLQSAAPVDPETKKPTEGESDDHPIRGLWFRILRTSILPALPLIRPNAVCTVEIWNLMKSYQTTTRWRLYGEWKASYKKNPELRVREALAEKESKDIMRRLSIKTIDSLSGAVGKLAHSNPILFFTNAVNQIMSYDNLGGIVIQALRYVTNMGFDVLVYIVLDALAVQWKPRIKNDGVNISDWLQSTSPSSLIRRIISNAL